MYYLLFLLLNSYFSLSTVGVVGLSFAFEFHVLLSNSLVCLVLGIDIWSCSHYWLYTMLPNALVFMSSTMLCKVLCFMCLKIFRAAVSTFSFVHPVCLLLSSLLICLIFSNE